MEEWRSELGYHQKSSWRHLDRLHEEVVELESPFAASFASGTLVFTFMLTGDQNAGKSTFLHAFTDEESPKHLELLSILPILSSSFVNSRFLAPDDPTPPRDEGPFLDTDLGYASIVLTADDFAFFVSEYGLDPRLVTQAPKDTIYFAVKFIEFGGDHLDRLMTPNTSGHPAIETIVQKSRQTLKTCQQIVYFVNAQHLLDDASVLPRLCTRLQYLDHEMPAGTKVLVLVTRCELLQVRRDAVSILRTAFTALFSSGEDGNDGSGDHSHSQGGNGGGGGVQLDASSAEALMNDGLQRVAHQRKWRLQLQRIFLTNHLDAGGEADPEAIMLSLSRFFKHEMIQSRTAPLAAVARHLIDCFKDTHSRIDEEQGTISLWISQSVFQEYLDEAETIIPAVTCLSLYNRVARMLCQRHLALRHHHGSYADVTIVFRTPSTRFVLPRHPPEHRPQQQQQQQPVLLRFPYHRQLLESCWQYLHRHVPDSIWISDEQGGPDTVSSSSSSSNPGVTCHQPESRQAARGQEADSASEPKPQQQQQRGVEADTARVFVPGRDDDVLVGIAEAASDLSARAQDHLNQLMAMSSGERRSGGGEAPAWLQLMCGLEDLSLAANLLGGGDDAGVKVSPTLHLKDSTQLFAFTSDLVSVLGYRQLDDDARVSADLVVDLTTGNM